MQWSVRLGLHSQDRYRDFVFLVLKYETETEIQNFGISRLFRDWNLGFFKTETFRDSAKIVETQTFSRLSLISVMVSPIAVPLQSRQRSHYSTVYFIVWSWLLVVRSRQITNYLTGQSRQGSNYLTGQSRQRSNYLTGLSRQIAFPFTILLLSEIS